MVRDMNGVRVALMQINTIVGGLKENSEKITFCIEKAKAKDADIVVFPELAVTGYPPEDLVLKPHFVKENIGYLNKIARSVEDIVVVVGFISRNERGIYNSAGILANKKVNYVYNKIHLPNYGVFDEKRYFRPGGLQRAVLKTRDFSFVVNICEDIWVSESDREKQVLSQAQFLINISASPYCMGKIDERRKLLSEKAKRNGIAIVYCNLIGGQDELIFDGRSAVFAKSGRFIAKAEAFKEDLMIAELPLNPRKRSKPKRNVKVIDIDYRSKGRKKSLCRPRFVKDMSKVEEVYSALVLGVHDYVKKNNFEKVAFGLSGGIDSALVASIAVDALGKTNVLALSMPSRYSSKGTQDDAEKISKNLGIRLIKVPIDDIFNAYLDTLKTHFLGMSRDITEENIQARIRGNILMAFSNKFGYLVLNTGNKSETSVGYCTLYGDMAGGFAVIKDVPKGLVYELVDYVNNKEKREIVPASIIKRPPSAELSPGQKDQDTLPGYGLLDRIVDLYIEKRKSLSDIIKMTGDEAIVRKVLRMIDANEYKRRQGPPGIKITPMAFGKDRRMPITNRFGEARHERDDA